MTDDQRSLDDGRVTDSESAAAVREVLVPLDRLERAPLSEHAAIFEGVHTGLQRLLAEPER
ncbi:hypothetical protein [Sanguibacter sp. 25GB23B1]|uniref:hypothetical protein n=1 Tax=unclassified Sanguibacter TaxID=2645534 RepID=UPI0032AEDE02